MGKLSVSVPDELIEAARTRHPAMNVSRVLQDALRVALDCPHHDLVCAGCGDELEAARLSRLALERFYVDAIRALEDLLWRGGSVEGSARVLRRLALEHGLADAVARVQLPRLSRGEREHRRSAARQSA